MTASFVCNKPFYDDKSFPYGFKRSGDFTIKESELLESIGRKLMSLAKGEDQPATDEEARFVKVAQGELDPESHVEKTWIKYRKLSSGRTFFGVTGNPDKDKVTRDSRAEPDDDDIDVDDGGDIDGDDD